MIRRGRFGCASRLLGQFAAQNRAEFLPDFYRVADLGLPFTHHACERRFDRINRLVRFHFAQGVIQFDVVAWIFEQRNNFGRANAFSHDRHGDRLGPTGTARLASHGFGRLRFR